MKQNYEISLGLWSPLGDRNCPWEQYLLFRVLPFPPTLSGGPAPPSPYRKFSKIPAIHFESLKAFWFYLSLYFTYINSYFIWNSQHLTTVLYRFENEVLSISKPWLSEKILDLFLLYIYIYVRFIFSYFFNFHGCLNVLFSLLPFCLNTPGNSLFWTYRESSQECKNILIK